MNKRGAYFFVIDALIGASIIFLSLIIIFNTNFSSPESNPTLRMMEDYTDYLVSTRVREIQGPITAKLVSNGNITNVDNTLLEQLTEFYYLNVTGARDTTNIMWDFTDEISKGLVSEQRSFSVYVNKTLVYEDIDSVLDQSRLVVNSKKISYKRINDTFIYGPVIIEVKLWV